MKSIPIPNILKKVGEIFGSRGFEAYLVGGAVRDALLGKEAGDWDIATNARPEQVMGIFNHVIPTGIAHGTVTIRLMGKQIETTTFRSESSYTDGRHPDSVNFDASLEDDLSRRDFTMNAIAASLKDGSLTDPFSGQRDIKAGIIRSVGEARLRFLEDGLRPIRAIRFSSQLNFKIEDKTYEAIRIPDVQEKIKSISIERFRDEFERILRSDEPSAAFRRMEETGILGIFIPELEKCRGCSQADIRSYHVFDVLDHNLYACDGAPKEKPAVRIAALLHDVGKTEAKSIERCELPQGSGKFTDIIHFHRHEAYSAEAARRILTRLRFPNALTDHVVHLVENHMFHFEEGWSDAAVRRFVVKVGEKYLEDIFDLRLADMYGKYRRRPEPMSDGVRKLMLLRDRIKKILSEKNALSLKDLAVNGKDLIGIGIPGGKRLGEILNELLQTVLDDPEMNDRERLLMIAKSRAGI